MKKTNGRFKLEASKGNRYNEQHCTNTIRKQNAHSGSELVDELGEEAMRILFEMFRFQIGELLLRLDEVDGDLSFFTSS